MYMSCFRYSNIPSKVITGVAKGMDYKPGQPLGGPGSSHHTWNAIQLKGDWLFLDIRFARRPVISNLITNNDIVFDLDDHFFLTDPAKFIYTHFPDEPQWQLLETPISKDAFCNMPVMTPHFYMLGLDLVSDRSYEIQSDGETDITIQYPTDGPPFHFTFSVHPANRMEDKEATILNKYGMFETNSGRVSFRIRLPDIGPFIFFIYAKMDTPEKKDSMFAQVCEYKIIQEKVSPNARPYPPCAYQCWGPSALFYEFGMRTENINSLIVTKDGTATVVIETVKTMQYRTRLVQYQVNTDFEGYVTYRTEGSKTTFSITAPARGEYGLEIYTKDPDADTKKMRHVAQYIILCDEVVKTKQLPRLPSGFLGQQPMLIKHGILPASHPDPIIHLDGNYVQIEFHTNKGMRFTSSLSEITDTAKLDCSEYIFTQCIPEGIRLCVLLPKTGFFAFCVHGNLFEESCQQIPGLFNYLLSCENITQPVVRYPKQFGYWKEGCFMLEPLAILPKKETEIVPFKVKIPKATTVAVIVNKDWTRLDLDEKTATWEGEIQLEQTGDSIKIVLVACYDDNQDRFASLLEYSV